MVALAGPERILRRMRQFFSSALARSPAHAAVGELDEAMTVEEFLTLLALWRERVVQVRSSPRYRAAAIVARVRVIGRYQVRRNPMA